MSHEGERKRTMLCEIVGSKFKRGRESTHKRERDGCGVRIRGSAHYSPSESGGTLHRLCTRAQPIKSVAALCMERSHYWAKSRHYSEAVERAIWRFLENGGYLYAGLISLNLHTDLWLSLSSFTIVRVEKLPSLSRVCSPSRVIGASLLESNMLNRVISRFTQGSMILRGRKGSGKTTGITIRTDLDSSLIN